MPDDSKPRFAASRPSPHRDEPPEYRRPVRSAQPSADHPPRPMGRPTDAQRLASTPLADLQALIDAHGATYVVYEEVARRTGQPSAAPPIMIAQHREAEALAAYRAMRRALKSASAAGTLSDTDHDEARIRAWRSARAALTECLATYEALGLTAHVKRVYTTLSRSL